MGLENKRILLITRNFPPLIGGMERLNWHIADELSKFSEIQVIGPTGAEVHRPSKVILTEVPLRPIFRFLLISGCKALRIARMWKPRIVLAGSGLTAPLAWLAARCCGAKAMVYLHGLDISVNHTIYRIFWLPLIRRMDYCLVNSSPTRQLALDAGVKEERVCIVHPGVQLPDDSQSSKTIEEFREKHGLVGKKILLSVGRLSRRKGLLEFVENAMPQIVENRPDVVLVVIGDAPRDALHAKNNSLSQICDAAEVAGVLKNIIFLGNVSEVELLAAYGAASLHIFPIRNIPGDPEGFGMVAIEAAAHGVPTIGFATGGVIDAVSQGQSGMLVTPGDYVALVREVLSALMRDPQAWRIGSVNFACQFAWPVFGAKLQAVLKF